MLSRDHDERSTTFHHGKNIMAKRDYWDELAEGGLQIELYRVPGFAFGDEEGTVNKFIAASPWLVRNSGCQPEKKRQGTSRHGEETGRSEKRRQKKKRFASLQFTDIDTLRELVMRREGL
jgi:hypothetical protein